MNDKMNKTQHEMPPYYPHYAKDWLTSDNVLSMGYFEKGVFIQLLSIAWVNDGLPNDEAKAKQMLGLCLEEWEACAWIVHDLFYDDGTKLRNKRQEVERKKYHDKVAKLRIAGRLGGMKSRVSKCLANATASVKQPEPEPEPDIHISKDISKWSFKKALEIPIPSNIDSPQFKAVWQEWIQHLKEKKKLPTRTAVIKQLDMLSTWGTDRGITALKHSMAGNYQGIYESNGAKQTVKPSINDQEFGGDI